MNEFKELIGSISGLANGETSINVEVALETRSIMYLCIGLLAVGIITVTLSQSL